MSDGAITPQSDRRIRVASALAWVVGAITMAVVVFTAIAPLRVADGLIMPPGGGAPGDYPWRQANPTVLTPDADGTIHGGAGGGVIRIPAAERTDALMGITFTDLGGDYNYVSVSLTPADDVDFTAGADREWPDWFGSVDAGDTVPLLQPGDLEIWIEADAAFSAKLGELEVQTITDHADGKGDALLRYDGDALSAHLVHRGEGIVFVTVYTGTQSDAPVIESGSVDTSFSWDPSDGPTLIRIEADQDRGAWSLAILGERPVPSPTPTDTPTTEQ